MPKEKGAVLGITVTFLLVFIMLGLGSVYFSGAQALAIQKRVSGIEAFWLAEAGIQSAMQFIINNKPIDYTDSSPQCLSTGRCYRREIDGTAVSNVAVRWQIDSTGTVGTVSGVNSHLRVNFGPNVLRAFTTTGTIDSPGSGGIDDHIEPDGSYLVHATFDLEGIFKITEAQILSLPGIDIYTNTANGQVRIDQVTGGAAVDGVTWINNNNGRIKATSNWEGSGLLVINGDEFTMEGTAHFSGVIWVEGACLNINGDHMVTGAVFVHDTNTPPGETQISGNSAIDYSEAGGGIAAVDAVFANIGSTYPRSLHAVLSWEEVH